MLTKSFAQKIYYAGMIFGIVVFLILTITTIQVLLTHEHQLTSQIKLGKSVWEKHNCIGCHSLLGNGTYYASELSNVYKRGGNDDIHREKFIKYWLSTVHTNDLKHLRQAPKLNLTIEEIDALVAFFKWVSEINTANWPPNIKG